jgi:D-3-phosphoglycerate dehydrogenase
MFLARQLGLHISQTRREESGDIYAGLVSVRMTNDRGQAHEVCGTVTTERVPKVVIIDGKRLDAVPEGHMLVISNRDVPGIIGSVGTCLGDHKINIAAMNVGRLAPGADALTVINIDQEPGEEVLGEIAGLPNILGVRKIKM